MALRPIPPLPLEAPVVDGRAHISPDWQLFFVGLLRVLRAGDVLTGTVPANYANDAAAAAGGVAIGGVYRNGSVLQMRVV